MSRRQWFASLFLPVFVKLGWTKGKVVTPKVVPYLDGLTRYYYNKPLLSKLEKNFKFHSYRDGLRFGTHLSESLDRITKEAIAGTR